MRDVWKSSLEWYIYYGNAERKAKFARVIMEIKKELNHIETIGDLGQHYSSSRNLARDIVKSLYPQEWWLDMHQVEDVAYGLRCIELTTGRNLDLSKGIPSRWIVETVA